MFCFRFQTGYDRLRHSWSSHLLAVHRVRHAADDGRQAQVQHQPRGVHLRRVVALPGHHQPIHVYSHDHRRIQERLKGTSSMSYMRGRSILEEY